MVTNRVVTHTTAALDASTVTATAGDIAVTADNAAGIDATLLTTLNSGDEAVSVSLAFNTLGYKPSNALFNLIDAILGDPLISTAFKGEDPALALATVTGTTLSATGAIIVAATNRAALNATVSNAADSTAGALFGAKGSAVGAIVASNKVSSGARATLDGGAITQAAAVAVTASDEASIHANIKVVASSITTNNGGTAVLQQEINNFKGAADFLTTDGAPGCPPRPDRARAGRQGLRVDGRRRIGRPRRRPTSPTSACGSRCSEPNWCRRGSTSRSRRRSGSAARWCSTTSAATSARR